MTAIDYLAQQEDSNWRRLPHCSLSTQTREKLSLRASRHATEICGFIIGSETVLPVANTSKTPHSDFTMDQKSILEASREHGPNITGIYHSHPSGSPLLSVSDEDGMKTLYRAGCPWRYFIVTARGVTEYRWIG